MAAPILVTGATGRIGGTGRHVAAELLSRGLPVRAMARRLDERSEELRGMGIEVVVADFADYTSLVAALDGIEAAYFCHPVGAGLAEAAGFFAAAGRKQGLQRIVDLSLDAAFPESPSPQGRAQWVAEQIFEWAGYGGTHLRVAAFFMENLLTLYGHQVRAFGQIRNSFGDFEPSWIASSDVGAMAAALLADPGLVIDRTTVVGAAERAGHAAIAEAISKTTGRPVRYQALTPEEWRDELITNLAAAGRPNPTAAGHLSAQSVELRRRSTHLVTDDVRRLTGRPAVTLEDFLERNRQSFLPDPGQE
ncbi:NmrA family NAD(P)-binding protein [Catellatospora chokoriensis]|uniref:NmrA family transcriptional regulator n=1 Tax=Catellatospora chokoriensis TaxID=310353 RepID=A0A8J3K3L2_9ACTN|nr:NmrA family NAD(P)-binding protein [Catellatospora chokoriensis]GIF93419.1 NmrA family transcriptional regulator [Catellatospora chokoriensis]